MDKSRRVKSKTIELIEFTRTALDDGLNYYFTIFSNSSGSEYSVNIKVNENEVIDWGCSCDWGVTWRFTEENMESDKKCKHFNFCLDILKHLNIILEANQAI